MAGQVEANEFAEHVASIKDAFYRLLDLQAYGNAEDVLFALAGVDELAWDAVDDVEWDDSQRRS